MMETYEALLSEKTPTLCRLQDSAHEVLKWKLQWGVPLLINNPRTRKQVRKF